MKAVTPLAYDLRKYLLPTLDDPKYLFIAKLKIIITYPVFFFFLRYLLHKINDLNVYHTVYRQPDETGYSS